MRFNYECKNIACLKKEKFYIIDKCPCKAFSKEYCTVCGEQLRKASKKAVKANKAKTIGSRVIPEPTETEVE